MYDISLWEPALRWLVILAALGFLADRWLLPRWPALTAGRARFETMGVYGLVTPVAGLLLFAICLSIRPELRATAVARNGLVVLAGLGLFVCLLAVSRRHDVSSQPGWLERKLELAADGPSLLVLAAAYGSLASLISQHWQLPLRTGSMATLAWLMSLGLAALGSQRPAERGRPLRLRLARGEHGWILGLLVLALLLRASGLDRIPRDLSIDESGAGEWVLRFAGGFERDLLGWGWFDFPALYFGLQAIPVGLLGATTTALRIGSALAGAATVPLVYLLARALYGRPAALPAALLLTVSHHHLYWSRIGLNNVWDGLFATLAVLGIWWGWARDWRPGFALAGLALGVGQYFYAASHLMPFVLLAWAAGAALVDRRRFRARLAGLSLAAYCASVAVLPLLLRSIREPHRLLAPASRQAAFGSDPGAQQLADMGVSKLAFALHLMKRTAGGFTHLSLEGFHTTSAPLLLAGGALLFLLALAWLVTRPDLRGLLLLLPLAATIVSGGFSLDQPAGQRFVLAAPFVAVIAGLPLGWLLARGHRAGARDRGLARWVVGLVLLLLAFGDLHHYFVIDGARPFPFGKGTAQGNAMARYLADLPSGQRQLLYFGRPEMPYANVPKYLLPATLWLTDVDPPPAAEASWTITRSEMASIFVFMPDRMAELARVRERYPGGQARSFLLTNGDLAFVSYELPPLIEIEAQAEPPDEDRMPDDVEEAPAGSAP